MLAYHISAKSQYWMSLFTIPDCTEAAFPVKKRPPKTGLFIWLATWGPKQTHGGCLISDGIHELSLLTVLFYLHFVFQYTHSAGKISRWFTIIWETGAFKPQVKQIYSVVIILLFHCRVTVNQVQQVFQRPRLSLVLLSDLVWPHTDYKLTHMSVFRSSRLVRGCRIRSSGRREESLSGQRSTSASRPPVCTSHGSRLSSLVEQESKHFNAVYFFKGINQGVKHPPGSVAVDILCVLGVPAETLTLSCHGAFKDMISSRRWGFCWVFRFVQQFKLCLILSVANIYT